MVDLLEAVPKIRRARGYRLYTEKSRLVDLYLDGGRAVLGHNHDTTLRLLKNTGSRGLLSPYPSFWTRRFEKALLALFPDCAFSIGAHDDTLPVCRPFMDAPPLPFNAVLPHPLAPPVIVRKMSDTISQFDYSDRAASPFSLAVTARSIHDCLNAKDRVKVLYPKVREAAESNFACQNNIYFFAKPEIDRAKWERLFYAFLEAGFLLPPRPTEPLILPGEMSKGEEEKLTRALAGVLASNE